MPVIITATDFSEAGEHAVDYACRIAVSQNARVAIIHSFMIPVMFSDIPMPGSLITDAEKDSENQMRTLVEKMSAAYPGLAIEGKVIYGSTIDALEEYAENNSKPWLIVIGNNGADASKWPDSTLMDTFRKLAYPVLAVPRTATYRAVKNICFAFDNKHTGNSVAISQVNDFSKQLNASLHVLNIQPDDTEGATQEIDADAKAQLAGAEPHYHFVYGAENTDKGIQEFVAQNDIDWLVMIPRKHSFFEGLFHKSHTKEITLHSSIPILAVHETEA
ncbi:MAG: universal stress protein [Flavipsychrobacter sp.]|jgi:nucleotide-binding universal stress UspA family protein|nr:universal stress protein [Flavipsychrobacter sp.]